MIHAMLCSPAMRDGLTPRFEPIDKFLDGRFAVESHPSMGGRWQSPKILRWIAQNPSGSNKSGHGLSSRTMARLAYRWGFDGVATYNMCHFQGLNRSEISGPFWAKTNRTSNTNCSPKNSG